mgnify:CR=1 FL=1
MVPIYHTIPTLAILETVVIPFSHYRGRVLDLWRHSGILLNIAGGETVTEPMLWLSPWVSI